MRFTIFFGVVLVSCFGFGQAFDMASFLSSLTKTDTVSSEEVAEVLESVKERLDEDVKAKEIKKKEGKEAEKVAKDCLEQLKTNQALFEKLKDPIDEFVNVAEAKTKKYYYKEKKKGNGQLDLFIKLVPAEFLDILEGTNFPIAKEGSTEDTNAAIRVLLRVCDNNKELDDLSDEEKNKMTTALAQEVFQTAIIDAYVSDAFTPDAKARIENAPDETSLENRWKSVAQDILKPGSALMTTCIDSNMVLGADRNVYKELEDIANREGSTCKSKSSAPVYAMTMSAAPSSTIGKTVSLDAPSSSRISFPGAPAGGGGVSIGMFAPRR